MVRSVQLTEVLASYVRTHRTICRVREKRSECTDPACIAESRPACEPVSCLEQTSARLFFPLKAPHSSYLARCCWWVNSSGLTIARTDGKLTVPCPGGRRLGFAFHVTHPLYSRLLLTQEHVLLGFLSAVVHLGPRAAAAHNKRLASGCLPLWGEIVHKHRSVFLI